MANEDLTQERIEEASVNQHDVGFRDTTQLGVVGLQKLTDSNNVALEGQQIANDDRRNKVLAAHMATMQALRHSEQTFQRGENQAALVAESAIDFSDEALSAHQAAGVGNETTTQSALDTTLVKAIEQLLDEKLAAMEIEIVDGD